MTPKQVIEWYGGGVQTITAIKLGISRQVVNNWVKRGRIPLEWQIQFHHETGGELKLDRKRRNAR